MRWSLGNRSGFSNHVSNLHCAASVCAGSTRAFIFVRVSGLSSAGTFFPLTRCTYLAQYTVRVQLRLSSGPAERLLDKGIFQTRNRVAAAAV